MHNYKFIARNKPIKINVYELFNYLFKELKKLEKNDFIKENFKDFKVFMGSPDKDGKDKSEFDASKAHRLCCAYDAIDIIKKYKPEIKIHRTGHFEHWIHKSSSGGKHCHDSRKCVWLRKPR